MTGRDEIIREMKAMENWMKTAMEHEEKLYAACMESEANYGAAMLSDGMTIAYRKAINYLGQIIANAERYWDEEEVAI